MASLPLSRTNRAILQQPFGFELTVAAAWIQITSATDPRSPELQPIRRWRECKRVHLDGAPTTMPTPLFLRASGKIITLRQKRRTVGGSLRSLHSTVAWRSDLLPVRCFTSLVLSDLERRRSLGTVPPVRGLSLPTSPTHESLRKICATTESKKRKYLVRLSTEDDMRKPRRGVSFLAYWQASLPSLPV